MSGKYHTLYVFINTLLLTYVFENFQNMSRNIWTRPFLIYYYTQISMECSLKETKVKLDQLADVDMLLIVK